LPSEDKLSPGPHRDFVKELHVLYDLAGQPAAREVSREIYKRPRSELQGVSHETVGATLGGRGLPAWPKVQAIVTVLVSTSVHNLDLPAVIARFHDLWLAARREVPDSH
jgi:hypothetical protein